MIAKIASVSPEGVTLQFVGDESPTRKMYKYISTYTPVEGDKVLIQNESDTYVVLGKIVP
ncbi:hypothetical protein [Anaerorhabdus sp.]|uniref:hypothetical protein n=1 Tax=Anaerorhabdus sp. TaxID=1872524 RepID=UPI002FCC3761